VDLPDVYLKLTLRAVVPLLAGILVKKVWRWAHDVFERYIWWFKKSQEYALVYIVYTVFCKAFLAGSNTRFADICLLIFLVFILMVMLATIAWYALKVLYRNEPELRVMGFYGCPQKTIALGIPLIASMFGGSPHQSEYTLPILIWHPMQLILGSLLVPTLLRFVNRERSRIDGEKTKETDESNFETESALDDCECAEEAVNGSDVQVDRRSEDRVASGCTTSDLEGTEDRSNDKSSLEEVKMEEAIDIEMGPESVQFNHEVVTDANHRNSVEEDHEDDTISPLNKQAEGQKDDEQV
jgi:uncharacterized membrane protein YphA (DoxX/SURF4 family)